MFRASPTMFPAFQQCCWRFPNVGALRTMCLPVFAMCLSFFQCSWGFLGQENLQNIEKTPPSSGKPLQLFNGLDLGTSIPGRVGVACRACAALEDSASTDLDVLEAEKENVCVL